MKSCQLSVVSCRQTFSRRVHAARDAGFGVRDSGLGFWQIPNPKSQISNPKSPVPRPPSPAPHGFTLVEMLVVVTIIGILAAMAFGALQMARETAREMATKSTIAKLNNVIMRRYESYKTRRVPISTAGLTPRQAAEVRLFAIRDLMRMEMPERWPDVSHLPAQLTINGHVYSVPQPALHLLYQNKYGGPNPPKAVDDFSHAKCLFMLVSMGSPEAIEQFHQSEIAVDPADGWQYFVDGWGKPIFFLRWAPGCSANFANGYSDIQSGDEVNDHDPFDTRRVDSDAFHLIPLIFSFGRSGAPNVNMVMGSYYGNATETNPISQWTEMDPYAALTVGEPISGSSNALGNITNHHIEQR